MREIMKKFLRFHLSIFALIVGLAAISISAQTAPSSIGGIQIRNFGQMDTNYYRGAQPKKEEYQALKAIGITTIIDLQEKPTKYEKTEAEALGMKYINIPMDDATYPPEASIAEFLKQINDPANGVMYVHCKGGRHRTGVTGAVYRFTKYGWDYDKVMKEMENYNFDTSYGRKVMKDFVVDYAAKMKNGGQSAVTSAKVN
jgi:protein tyrosine/serine phosphatase